METVEKIAKLGMMGIYLKGIRQRRRQSLSYAMR